MSARTAALSGGKPTPFPQINAKEQLVDAEGYVFELSFAQQRLWFLDQYEHDSSAYNLSIRLHLEGDAKALVFERAINEIVRRHESLRTVFDQDQGVPHQVVLPELRVPLALYDLEALPPGDRDARARGIGQQIGLQPFDLRTGPLIRAALIKTEPAEHTLLLTVHHIVSDGWSLGLLMKEIAVLYRAYAAGLPSPLVELPIQYPDYAVWQRGRLQGELLHQQLDYWKAQLEDAPLLLALPSDRARPAVQRYAGAVHRFVVPNRITSGLYSLGRRNGTTLFMALMAALHVLLSRYSGQADICVGTPTANRSRAELEPVIGLFINTVVIRTHIDANASFLELLQQVRTTALGAYAHQELPFERVVDALAPQRGLAYQPLFQVMLILQNTPKGRMLLPGVTVTPMAAERQTTKFDLTLSVSESEDRLVADLEYNTDLFDASTIERMGRHFTQLLTTVVEHSGKRIAELPLLLPDELVQLKRWNDTRVEAAGQPPTLHAMWEAQARRTPDAVALVFEDAELNYSALDMQANRLAHRLRGIGVGPEVLVALCVERSPAMVIALLAILKAGGAYVPLDPGYPSRRLAFMLSNAAPAVLLTVQSLLAQLPPVDIPTWCLDDPPTPLPPDFDAAPPDVGLPYNLAYVIYTSGSTGQPKGVGVTHANVCNLLQSMHRAPGLRPTDVMLNLTSLSFDIAALEIFLPLTCGAKTVLASREVAADAQRLADIVERNAVTTMQAPPSTWRMLLELGWPQRPALQAWCGGEALAHDLAARLLGCVGTLWNLYGPTETTIWSTARNVDRTQAVMSIGQPIANTQIHVLDAWMSPLPVGVPGEIFIAGEGVARGYLKRPNLTAERFVPDPFVDMPGSRMYRSGDLGRWLPDGTLECLGRLDHQVKVRGFRIETGEIETALLALDEVREVAVLTIEHQVGDNRLVAFVVPKDKGWKLNATALREALSLSLPSYMLPGHFEQLDALPLTPNGKLDRNALPEPNMTGGETGHVAARTPTEMMLASLWAEVLHLDRIGIHDNFFHFGGHSLLAMQLMSKLRASFGFSLPLRTLFEAPDIQSLAQAIDKAHCV